MIVKRSSRKSFVVHFFHDIEFSERNIASAFRYALSVRGEAFFSIARWRRNSSARGSTFTTRPELMSRRIGSRPLLQLKSDGRSEVTVRDSSTSLGMTTANFTQASRPRNAGPPLWLCHEIGS